MSDCELKVFNGPVFGGNTSRGYCLCLHLFMNTTNWMTGCCVMWNTRRTLLLRPVIPSPKPQKLKRTLHSYYTIMISKYHFPSIELAVISIQMLHCLEQVLHISSCLPTLSHLESLDPLCNVCSVVTLSSCSRMIFWPSYKLLVAQEIFDGIFVISLLTVDTIILCGIGSVQIRN